MPVAVIDSGTNTFVLNIYYIQADSLVFRVVKQRYYVDLAEQGIDFICHSAWERALNAYSHFKKTIMAIDPNMPIYAMGTAALRIASNGYELVDVVKQRFGIDIQIIDGAKEAQLIYKGVRLAAPLLPDENSLVIDIGGGSVEFILCNATQIIWAQSFQLGGSFLYHKFKVSDPMLPQEQKSIEDYLDIELDPLRKILETNPAAQLIGASGTFDALTGLLNKEIEPGSFCFIEQSNFYMLFKALVSTTLLERLEIDRLLKSRAKFVVVSMIIVQKVLDLLQVKSDLIASDYALREGVLADLELV